MPFVLMIVGAFLLAMVFDKGPSKRLYILFAIAAAAGTVYYFSA